MSSLTEYVFHFDQNEEVRRIPFAKWSRIREGDEALKDYANQSLKIAYAYILLENRKPDYCPRIDGTIYYFDKFGYVIKTLPKIDLLNDIEEEDSGVIDFQYRKERYEYLKLHKWKLDPKQIGVVIDLIKWA